MRIAKWFGRRASEVASFFRKPEPWYESDPLYKHYDPHKVYLETRYFNGGK